MSTQTITIDLDAYARLKKQKKRTESFSETIQRVVPEPVDLDRWTLNGGSRRFAAIRSARRQPRPSRGESVYAGEDRGARADG